MKKISSLLIASLLVLIMATSLMACNRPSGTYKFYEVHYKDEDMDITVSAEDFLGKNDLPYWVLDFYEHLPEITYEFSGNNLTATMGDKSETIKFKMDGKIIMPTVIDGEKVDLSDEEIEEALSSGAQCYEDGNIVMRYNYANGTQIKVIFKKVTQ